MTYKKTICLDFDGVMNTYDGWKGESELFEPRSGLEDFLRALLASLRRVAVFSTRNPLALREWLVKHYPWTELFIQDGDIFFPERKPPADCYVDDRAVLFTGSFEEILPTILNFKAHWEKEKA